ncbi:hypothetical protein AB4Z21_15035, partial [Paenibacillus sp. MCAF20]
GFLAVQIDDIYSAISICVSRVLTIRRNNEIRCAGGGEQQLILAVSRIYEVDALIGGNKLLAAISDSVSEIIVSRHGHLAALIDGQLAVSVNGQWKNITQ